VGEQTPEKCVQGEEGKKEHPLLTEENLSQPVGSRW